MKMCGKNTTDTYNELRQQCGQYHDKDDKPTCLWCRAAGVIEGLSTALDTMNLHTALKIEGLEKDLSDEQEMGKRLYACLSQVMEWVEYEEGSAALFDYEESRQEQFN